MVKSIFNKVMWKNVDVQKRIIGYSKIIFE